MTFDDYYQKLQPNKFKKINPAQFCQNNQTTLTAYNQYRDSLVALFENKILHLDTVISHKLITIRTHGFNDIQVLRDFYHYLYYYLFFKSRAILIKNDYYDCTYHKYVDSRLSKIPTATNPHLAWITNSYGNFKDLRIMADYLFDEHSRIYLSNPQTFKQASSVDWTIMQGITL